MNAIISDANRALPNVKIKILTEITEITVLKTYIYKLFLEPR